MFIRLPPMVLALSLLGGAFPAAAQRIDILTGEPVRPPSAHPRPEPEIFNAPHAPRQQPGRAGDNPPIEIYVQPQIDTGGTGMSTTGAAGPLTRGSTRRPLSQYPGRFQQERPY